MNLKKENTPLGEATLVTLTNASGASVTLSTLGGGVVKVVVPDSRGHLADVVIGYDDISNYVADGPCAGKIPGRYANRIARGKFSIDGEEYSLNINNGPNHLHGGPTGFQNRIWTLVSHSADSVTMQYVSADGEEGYPGKLTARATYTWSGDNTLRLDLEAVVEGKPTVVNLTNHSYFNLSGHNSGSVLGHELELHASRFLPTDDTLIPTGELCPVVGTPMDFTTAKAIGRDINADYTPLKYAKGYDHCWAIDGYEKGKLSTAAVLSDPASGRSVEIATTQPGMQVYTGNWLTGSPEGKDGAVYTDYCAVAIECQAFPDSPNEPAFPSTVLRPGETFHEIIEYRFKA